ncbi:MAG: alternative ribosome rescue aminoacyl-tRNA hydrolase ArfB, partial [Planctomycetota bacterium]
MSDLYINARLTIPASQLHVSFARSGGPGGQNVNKVNSKVTLKFAPRDCRGLDSGWLRRVETRFGNRINRGGQLVLHSEKYRDQVRNLADVRQKLCDMLLQTQAPPKARKPTRPTAGS